MTAHHQEEEYTDYSCSTAIERLSRDVETVLRAWHVDRGGDRHVSITKPNTSTSNSSSSSNTNTSNAKSHTKSRDAEDPTCPLIRSNTIPWNVSVTTREGRSTVTIDLELALWDAPEGGTSMGSGIGGSGNGNGTSQHSKQQQQQEDDESDPLVKSLRRTPFSKMPDHDYLFDNFAHLFGIGQHISLTPIVPDPIPVQLVQSLGSSVLQRHDDQATAIWVLGSTLSGWLQNSLNIATANCHCCIPVFGVWGVYRPNGLEKPPTSNYNFNSNSSIISGSRSRNGSTNGNMNMNMNTNILRSTSSLSNKSIGNGSLLSDLPEHDHLLGTTINGMPTSNNNTFNNKSSNSNNKITTKTGVQVFPQWTHAIRSTPLPPVGRKYRARAQAQFWNQHFLPPIICGNVICGPHNPIDDSSQKAATLWVSCARNSQNNRASVATTKNSRLAVWASVLLQHCPDQTVVLSGARHVFGWFKPKAPPRISYFSGTYSERMALQQQGWRSQVEVLDASHDRDDLLMPQEEFDHYKKHCQAHVLDLLDEAWGCRDKRVPMWGPKDDPVASIYATTTWNGKGNPDQDGTTVIVEPLLSFPLRIRSRRELSKRDWIDMEESVERTILDPLSTPSKFSIQVYYDRDTSMATLAANQRCSLAALIRAATLPGETLLQHLADEELVDMWDDDAGTIVANKLALKSKVGRGTRQIVQVMDWSSVIEDMISLEQAEEIVHLVMNGELTAGFPSSPEEAFIDNDLFSPFRKSAPLGRLLSILFAHMAKLRALSSMALVWGVFVQELRRRWEHRESLPNMLFVSGLDPHPLELYEKRCFTSIGHKANFSSFLNCSEPDPDDYHCLIGQKLQVFNIGVECVVAGEILEHETMERFLTAGQIPATASLPEMEGTNASDVNSIEPSIEEIQGRGKRQELIRDQSRRKKWPKAKDKISFSEEDGKNYGPPVINSDLEFWVMDELGHAPKFDEVIDFVSPATDDTGFDFVAPPPADLDDFDDCASRGGESYSKSTKKKSKTLVVEGLPDQAWEGTIMEDGGGDEDDDEGSGDSAASRTTQASQSQAYYDAAEAGSIFSMKHGFVSLDTVVNVADMMRRPGARCPVQGISLGGSGDQLYAPYLQRPFPLTDDLVLERRVMLGRNRTAGEKKKLVLQSRLDLAHRLQKPKLLSDMASFKAANPSTTIDDFTRWYGNPGSPLDEYDEDPILGDVSVADAYYESAAKKLDKASEAMRVLTSIRDFWSSTWEEADPIPASEQQPLFDFATTVEMAIDYLEQMHPANLVNQVMAVNLSSAYFTLIANAAETLKVGLVQSSFHKLRLKVDKALQLLSHDATGALFQFNDTSSSEHTSATSNQYTSEEAIFACEEACNALAVSETMVARAMSLLQKFPDQFDLVQDLLRVSDGTMVALMDPKGRSSFLSAIHQQQKQHSTFASGESLPKPVLREYVLRNLDDGNPCQLSVRFGDEGAYLDRVDNEGGVLLALLKSYND